MPKFVDLTGQRFNRLVALNHLGAIRGRHTWKCKCDCGKVTNVRGSSLTFGNTNSCGCYAREQAAKRRMKHGLTRTSIYRAWSRIKLKCFDPSNPAYKDYGGRGITMCDRWKVFENFYADMGHPPRGMSIDRKNNNGNYEPSNCRWATSKEQSNNRRSNHPITLYGKTLNLTEWSRIIGIDRRTISQRLKKGWTAEKALTVATH